MERSKGARALQGGGSGEGLSVPSQIIIENQDSRKNIAEDMKFHIERSEFHNKDNRDKELWMSALSNRIKFLNNERKLIQPGPADTPENLNSEKIITPDEKLPMTRYIPGVPKTVEDLIELWRVGRDSCHIRPVHLFDKAEDRKLIISGYKDYIWNKSGQKCAYLRFKRLIKGVLTVADGENLIENIFCAGEKQKWLKRNSCTRSGVVVNVTDSLDIVCMSTCAPWLSGLRFVVLFTVNHDAGACSGCRQNYRILDGHVSPKRGNVIQRG
eukprot:IDg23716t1